MDSSALLQMCESNILNLKKSSGDNYKGTCPSGNHNDRNPSWSINIHTSEHHCFSCDFKGNGVTLAKHLDLDPKPFYTDDYKHNQTLKNGHIKTNNVYPKQVNNQSNLQNNKVQNRPLLGLKKTIQGDNDIIDRLPEKIANRYTLDAWNELGVLYNTFYNKLVFPIKNKESEWVNCYYHKPNPYFHSKGFKTQLYPLELIKHFNPNDVLFVVEGLKDVLTMRSRGYQAISSTGGKKIPEDLSAIKHFKFICVIPDNDDNGKETAYKWCKELYALGIKVLICDWSKMKKEYPVKYDVSDIDEHEIIELINTGEIYKPPVEIIDIDTGGFTEVDLSRVRKQDFTPTQFDVENLMISNQFNMICGESGSGKSYFTLQLLLSLLKNRDDFLGFKINIKNPKILYYDTEVGSDEVLERIYNINQNFQPIDYDYIENGKLKVFSSKDRVKNSWEYIIDYIKYFNPNIVVVDCLYNTAKGVNTSKANEVDKILDHIHSIRKQYPNVTILVVHHFNKGNSSQGISPERLSGASNILWSVSGVATAIVMSGLSSHYRIIKCVKSRGKNTYAHYLLSHSQERNWIEMEGVEHNPEMHFNTTTKSKFLIQLHQNIIEMVENRGEGIDNKHFMSSEVLNLKEKHRCSEAKVYRSLKELANIGMIEYVSNDGPSKKYKLGAMRYRTDKIFSNEE
jgi:KaiC/GvpD/RAD55 family RecA-like ATPase/5S rRNA maturation endonuclease (ribonuclease M5)